MGDALVGGVEYSSGQGDAWSTPDTTTAHGDLRWFCPLDVLAQMVGPDNELYAFWCATCGYSTFTECMMVDVSAFFTQENPPSYPCLTPAAIKNYDICEIFYEWMFSSFFAMTTGRPEGPCVDPTGAPGPPPPPAPPPGGG